MADNGQGSSHLDTGEDNRREPGSAPVIPASFPTDAIPDNVEPDQVANDIVSTVGECIAASYYGNLVDLFAEGGYLRDHLCLSWDLRTLAGREKIAEYLALNGQQLESVTVDRSAPHRAPGITQLDIHGNSKCIGFFTCVTTKVGAGRGYIRLIHRDGKWKIFTFYLALREIKGHEEPRKTRRPKGAEHSGSRGTRNWLETRQWDKEYKDKEPTVLIIGGGQAGLTSAARLKMLNVDALVIDRNERVGDNWRQRYRQLVLHDPVWVNDMPYMPFPDYWPVFTPKDKLADFFEAYVSLLELNVWMSTSFGSATWDDAKQIWTVTVERKVGGKVETRVLHPRHIIQATGHSGKMNLPAVKGMDSFQGRLCHSSQFPGAKPDGQGKRAVVVGSCNSGHDIAQDYYENGYQVTMVQRSSTCIVSSSSITNIVLGSAYAEENTPPVDDADLMLWSTPTTLQKSQHIQVTQLTFQNDKDTIQGLEKAGFKVDMGIDKSGLLFKYFQRGGGYYIDVGCSELIIEGKIAVKQGQEVAEVLPNGLQFPDGSTLEADEIVFATGYQNMRSQARLLMGDQVADKLNDVWGFDEEGEWRTMWRQSGHPGYWFMGGNFALVRYYGQYLALQIKALEEGLATYK